MHKDTIFIIKLLFFTLLYFDVLSQQLINQSDSIKNDSTRITVSKKTKIEAPVHYTAEDSIVLDLEQQKSFLFNNSFIEYEETNLKSYFIEIDLSKNEAFAYGKTDSTGKEILSPVFKDGNDEFEAKTLRYNFKTKKGIITDVITEQSGGYLHGLKTKKFEDNTVCIKNAKYTTCNLEHPHFYITLSKAKVIPNDKIVSGPAYLVIEDIPLPLGIPFGFFPNKKSNKSGIIIPEYGEEEQRGFFLRNGGYYFAISDYVDLSILGEAYTKGSWGISALSNYKKRYKYSGNLNLAYSNIIIGERNLPNFQSNNSYYIRWVHYQDAKAHPYHKFSANVNISSQSYNRFNMYSVENRLRSETQSSISYNYQWPNAPFNLAITLRHNQNYTDSTINLILPDIYFNMYRKTILKKINISFNSNLQNNIYTKEKYLFTESTLRQMRNGIKHSVPVSANFKIFRYFNLGPSLSYTERWYLSSIQKTFVPETISGNDTIPPYIATDTLRGFYTARDWSFSLPLSTQLYGFYMPKNTDLRFKGLRHLLTTSISFNYRPDYTKKYYRTVTDNSGKTSTYSIFQNGIFGTPPSGKYGSLNFSLNNQFEMKLKSKNDTTNKTNKITLLDQLSFNTGYNLAVDSLNWQPISITARTFLFKIFSINFGSSYHLYTVDSLGRTINKFQYQINKKIANLQQAYFSTSFSLNSDGIKKQNTSPKISESARQAAIAAGLPDDYLNHYVDFKIPWTLSFSYNLNIYNRFDIVQQKYKPQTTQTLSFSGDFSITPKWKLYFSSGYDFVVKKFTYTSLNIYRDLHCWEMRLSWIPFGTFRSYSFQINVKSSVLQDLKLSRKRPFIDNF